MLEIKYTRQMKSDLRTAVRQGKDIGKLEKAISIIAERIVLPPEYNDHKLLGNYKNHRECHIEPNWLLIYKIEKENLILTAVRVGSHAELFGA